MWLFTSIGFYSIVERAGAICVRARSRKDIEAFRTLMPGCGAINATRKTDYPFRVMMSKADFRQQFYRLAELVDYPNFKSKVAQTNPARAQLYAPVWAHLMKIEEEEHGPRRRSA